MAWLSAYVFGPDTKLKINGEFVSYKRYEGDMSDGSDGTMWVLTDLNMTPQASGTTPEYKITEGANADTLSVGKHTLTVVYNDGECSTEFEIKAAQSGGNTTPDKPNQEDPESPQTGDNSNLMLWIVLLFISRGTVIGITIVSKKKKHSVK